MNFQTILIDDEPLARKRLARLLSKYEGIFEIIAEAGNGKEGLEKIEQHKPDLIFLDIEMPLMNGFQMLQNLKHMPIVVFSTAYDQFAIKAFEQNSIDYLLKPVEQSRLDVTVNKLKQFNKVSSSSPALDVNNLMSLIDSLKPKKEITAIPVKIGDRIVIVNFSEIAYFEAKEKYVFIYTTQGKEYLIDDSLNTLEEKLPSNFIRIHRAYMINKNKVKELRKSFKGNLVVYMDDVNQTKLTSGVTHTAELKEKLGL